MQDNNEINKVVYLNNNDILPNRFQPRKYFDEEEIMQLSESIKEHGVINPIIVRKLGDKYELVAGERRYKANILAGNDDIPAIIMDVNDKESSEIAVVENIQRKDLNAIEEAISYKRILDIGYMTQEKLAQKMGKSQASIANKIRLLKLSDEVQDALMKKEISERHARSLLKLDSQKQQNEMLERIIKERLTVRKTDEEIDKMNNNMNNMNVNLNNMYNNNANNITPVMPGTNVSDVNISGSKTDTTLNNPINTVEPIVQQAVSPEPVVEQSVVQQATSPEPVVEQPVVQQAISPEPVVQQPAAQEVQAIPTVSIDDVLAKANQPSVVGPQVFTQPTSIENNQPNDSGIPNLTPINEEPTPINSLNSDSNSLNMTNITPINEEPISMEQQKSDVQNQSSANISVSGDRNTGLNNNKKGFEMPELAPISENPDAVDDFLNSINTPGTETLVSNPTSVIGGPEPSTMPEANINTFGNISEENNISSPINTSPIIDATTEVKNEVPEDNFNVNNFGIDNNAMAQPQQQIEPVPEPIIVNDYNDQYDPIMPNQDNAQPTIDFKTIINLIRKCSQAIENSGYKIETEEYNLDNIYQVVFKIDKK